MHPGHQPGPHREWRRGRVDFGPDIAYIEGPGGDLYLEAEGEVAQRRLAFDKLGDTALSPQESVALITRIKEEVTVHA